MCPVLIQLKGRDNCQPSSKSLRSPFPLFLASTEYHQWRRIMWTGPVRWLCSPQRCHRLALGIFPLWIHTYSRWLFPPVYNNHGKMVGSGGNFVSLCWKQCSQLSTWMNSDVLVWIVLTVLDWFYSWNSGLFSVADFGQTLWGTLPNFESWWLVWGFDVSSPRRLSFL